MKNIFLSILLTISVSAQAFSQDISIFNGKTVGKINAQTSRISPEIVRKKFLMNEGDVFFEENYNDARHALHDMRVFKSIDFNITDNEDGSITIDINAKDGFYVFPLIFGVGGSKSTFAAALIEANLFKAGETVMLFGAFNSDGFTSMAGFGVKDNFFSLAFSDMKYTEYVYANGSYSSSGLFTAEPDNDKFGKPVNQYDVRNNTLRVSWSRSFHERAGITLGFSAADINYKGSNSPDDEGVHNKIIIGIRNFKNMRPGGRSAGFGALFGIGLSDMADRLADLQKERLGYFAELTYENGGDYTGSDFAISKAGMKLTGNIEFKTRNVLYVDFASAKNFEAPFHDRIKSKDVLSGKGIYSREFRGDEAIGTGISFVWYPVKNKTGVLSVMPFIENAVLWNGDLRHNHGGAGASVSYQFWRIPFPIGINYTQNLNDGSGNVSLLFGGGF